MTDKKLFLLDAYALIFRAYYAFINNPMRNSKGLNTSAVFGFVNTLDDVLRHHDPAYIAVAFDPPRPTFRHEIFEDYKANRPPTPEGIKQAVPYIKQILEAYKIPVLEVNGYEADDVIGTLSKMAEKEGFEVYMMTSDKDYCQLVSDRIRLFKPRRSGNAIDIWGVEEVKEKFKVDRPEQVIDVLALWGDSSDNIPGVPGIGEKTAKSLISRFDSVEAIYDNIKQLKGKQKQNLLDNKKQLELSKFLVTIKLDVPLEIEFEKLARQEMDKAKLKALFEELEFKGFIKRIVQEGNNQPALSSKQVVQTSLFVDDFVPAQQSEAFTFDTLETVRHSYFLVDTPQKRCDLIRQLSAQELFCIDTETTGLEVHESDLVGMSFAFKPREAFYVPVPAVYSEAKAIVMEFAELFANENILKIGQNCKFDILILRRYGITWMGTLFDTMLAHYLIQPELKHNMDYLAETYLKYKPVSIESLIGKKGKQQRSMRSVDLESLKEYAAEDADISLQLYDVLKDELVKYNLQSLAEGVEMPLVLVLADMEATGVKIDREALEQSASSLRKEIITLENDIQELAGVSFNVSSPKQLGEVLFDRMKIVDKAKKTAKSGQYSTSEQQLMKLIDKHEIIPKILEYRSLRKLLSTYVEALPKLINTRTKRIHTSYNQAVVATGRLSSNNPNLQNIPIKDEKGRIIRKAFVPSEKENLILAADYSQIELRLMAHLSDDEHMKAAFVNGEDIHSATAAKIFKVKHEEVTKDQRRQAKSANFGIIYGISAFGLAQNLGISSRDSKLLIDSYFDSYPGVKAYMDAQIALAREKKYVETIMGRRRYLPDIDSRNGVVRGVAERNAINAPVQGSAADIIKLAMIKLFAAMQHYKLKAKMIMQVHDELVFDVPRHELDVLQPLIRENMEKVFDLSVPLSVDIGLGNNWLEAH